MRETLATSSRYPRVLLVIIVLYWLAWAFRPVIFSDWLLENVLQVLGVLILILTHRRFPLSNISYTLIFIFCALHTMGAHYSYSLVPYDLWSRNLLGISVQDGLGWQRNHYDRLVHFSFGFLLSYPIREYFMRIVGAKGFWSYYPSRWT